MDDCVDDISNYSDGLAYTSSYILKRKDDNEEDENIHILGSKNQAIRTDEDIATVISRATATNVLKKVGDGPKAKCIPPKNVTSTDPYCHVKLDSIIQLKDSTRKLLRLLEDIQLKSSPKRVREATDSTNTNNTTQLVDATPSSDVINSVTEVCTSALKKLETQTQLLETITATDEDDDCSVFKKLTRKCNCLTQHQYNDFVIHFNEETKFFTTTSGEIIKNLRILKKFLYMGGNYTKHALMFVNEGLGESSYAEKVEIIQGCAHTDMCNVFDDVSLVIACIAWPYKYDSYGDTVTQELAASFLEKLAQLEEGRRYLKFTSKISNDIKKVCRLKGSKLDCNTVDSLQATLDALDTNNCKENLNVTHYCRPNDEGYGAQTMNALIQYRRYMTMSEIFTHLDLLNKLSCEPKGKQELMKWLKALVLLFKQMLWEYNDSEMNIIVTNILNNLVSRNMVKQEEEIDTQKVFMVADVATEPIHMKNECVQIPKPKKSDKKKSIRLKSCINMSSFKGTSRRNVSDLNFYSRTAKCKEKSQVIIVPKEKTQTIIKKI